MNSIARVLPGLLLVLAISIPATCINKFVYKPISAVFVAIIAGVIIRNVFGLGSVFVPGNTLAVKKLLRLGIILMGIRLSFCQVVGIGLGALPIIVICIVSAIVLVHLLCRRINLPGRLATLIGVGTSICGVSAIVATSPAIGADEEETAFAVGTISMFGLLAVILYPFIGHMLNMSDTVFGTWAGTAVNDTSQVVATSGIYSQEACKIATVIKLTRNLFMAPVIILMSLLYARAKAQGDGDNVGSTKIDYVKAFPLFVLGFVAMAILSTLNHPDETTYRYLTKEGVAFIKDAASFLIVTAIAGVGLQTN